MRYSVSIVLFLAIPFFLLAENSSRIKNNKTAKDFFDHASKIRKTEPEKAIKLYLKAYEMKPASGFYAARIGQHYYYELREIPESINYYKKAMQLGFKGKWAAYQYVKALRWMMHFRFAENDWTGCKTYMEVIDSILQKRSEIEEKFPDWKTRSLLIRKRISYGNDIKPEYTHKILVIMIKKIKAKHKNNIINGLLKDKEHEFTRLSMKCLANYIPALTEGNIVIKLEWAEWDKTISGLKIKSKDKYVLDVEKVSIEMSPLLTNRLESVDTVFLIWPSLLTQTAHGGGTKFLLDKGNKQVWRGVVQIPAMRMTVNGPWLVIHEFFHVVENMAGIRPRHGFSKKNRENFPDWKGETELDYYYWQLGTNIGKIFSTGKFANTPGWSNFNFKNKYSIKPAK